MKNINKIRTQIFLTKNEIKEIEIESKENQLCRSEIIRRIIDNYFKNKNNKKND